MTTVSEDSGSFKVGIDFESVLRAISKQVYETPLAFIRENVQNAVDAILIQARRDGVPPDDEGYRIDVTAEPDQIRVRDNGIGMSASDLENYFWTIGASGKRTQEAIASGCVGMFGIGGFANFGVCHTLEVISQTPDSEHGTLTRLSEANIQEASGAIPDVSVEESDQASQGALWSLATCASQRTWRISAATCRTPSSSCRRSSTSMVRSSRRTRSRRSKIKRT